MKVNEKDLVLFDLIFEKIRSKEELANCLQVSTKTIENRLKNLKDVIKYSKKFGGYVFLELLPKYISANTVFYHIFKELENAKLELEFQEIFANFYQQKEKFINSLDLSKEIQKIIMLNHAINHNIIISFEYKGEIKIVRANCLKISNAKRYIYATYDKLNKKNIGKSRTFALNDIKNIKKISYAKEIFKNDLSGNAFGYQKDKKSVILYLQNNAASFFKRENPKSYNYRFISEDDDGIEIEFFYAPDSIELESFIAAWLPHIHIKNDEKLANETYAKIAANLQKLNAKF